MSGILKGVGVGPGDPELITLKGLRAIQAADVIAYPALEQGDSLARAIAAPHIPDGPEEYVIRMPMTEARFPAQEVYDAAADKLGADLTAGRNVVVLCEGDPFFYGSFMYLFARLAERFETQVVPGVSSLMACPAAAGVALGSRNDVLSVLPAPLSDEVLRKHLEAGEAAAIIKVGRHFDRIRRLLEDLDLAESARYIERASMHKQQVLPLADVDAGRAPYFSMILVHKRGEAWR